MRNEIIIHSFVDEHGLKVDQPVLVRVSERDACVCDVDLLGQLSDAGGSVAIVRDGHLGDLLMLTPTIRQLRHDLPGLKISVLCSQMFLRTFLGNPYIDGYEQMSSAAKKKFTYSVDLRGYVERVAGANTVDRTTLFGQAFGIEIEDGTPDFVVTEEDREKAASSVGSVLEKGKLIVIAPDASDKRRCLTGKFIAEFESLMHDAGYSTYVTGPDRGSFPGLGELGAIVDMASAVVCGDNGVYHLAAAMKNTPSFPIFTTIDPSLRCCWYSNCTPILSPADCAPCHEDPVSGCTNNCMSLVSADHVAELVLGTVN